MQKHITGNETLLKLDAIVQPSVVSATTSAEPGSPAGGQVYILPVGSAGAAWGDMADHALAYYRDGVGGNFSARRLARLRARYRPAAVLHRLRLEQRARSDRCGAE